MDKNQNPQDETYSSFQDLMLSRYNLTPDQIESLLQHCNWLETEWESLKIQLKMDFLRLLEIDINEVIKNPQFLKLNHQEISNKIMIGKLAEIIIDEKYLNANISLDEACANIKAIERGYLPKDTNILLPASITHKMTPMSLEDFMFEFLVFSQSRFIKSRFGNLYPETFKEFKKITSRKKIKKVDPRKEKLKKQIQEIYASDRPNKIKTKVSLDQPYETKDIVYSTAPEKFSLENQEESSSMFRFSDLISKKDKKIFDKLKKESPLFEVEELDDSTFPIQDFEEGLELKTTSKPEKTSIKKEHKTILSEEKEEQETNLNNNVIVEKHEDYSLTDEEFNEILKDFSITYNIPPATIKARQEFCYNLFGLTRDEFVNKLETSNKLLLTSEDDILRGVDLLKKYLFFTKEQIKRYCITFDKFPSISVNKTKEKLEMLSTLGIDTELASTNFGILKVDYNKLLLRAKLAYINNLPLDLFISKFYRYNENAIWAKMQASKAGIIREDIKFYNPSYYFNSLSEQKEEDIIKLFPLDDKSLEEIDERFDQLVESGKCWRFSQKNNNSTENFAYSTPVIEYYNQTDYSQTENKPDVKADVVSIAPIAIENYHSQLSNQTMLDLLVLFDCSPSELDKILKISNDIIDTDPKDIKELKTFLKDNYEISDSAFSRAIKTSPYLAIKKPKDIISIADYCSSELKFDKNQIKDVILKSAGRISDPADIFSRGKIISEQLDIPLKQASLLVSLIPQAYHFPEEELIARLQKLKEIFSNQEIANNFQIISVNENSIKLKFMLSRLNNCSKKEFLSGNFMTNEAKIYARMMFNLMYQKDINVYLFEGTYKAKLKSLFTNVDNIPAFVTANEPTEELMKIYPFDYLQKKQIELMYNTKFSTSQLTLTQEELDYGK